MRRIALVFAGGFCGALARYFLSAPLLAVAGALLPGARAGFPYDVLAVNLSGACALGLLYGLVERGTAISPDVRLTLGTGFLGAYTTFSSLVVGGDKLFAGGQPRAALLYCAGSVVLGVLCARAGYAWATRDRRRILAIRRPRALPTTQAGPKASRAPLGPSRRNGPQVLSPVRARTPQADVVPGYGFRSGSGEEDEIAEIAGDDGTAARR